MREFCLVQSAVSEMYMGLIVGIFAWVYLRTSILPEVFTWQYNPLKAELNPICHLLALLGTHHILHFSRIRVK